MLRCLNDPFCYCKGTPSPEEKAIYAVDYDYLGRAHSVQVVIKGCYHHTRLCPHLLTFSDSLKPNIATLVTQNEAHNDTG